MHQVNPGSRLPLLLLLALFASGAGYGQVLTLNACLDSARVAMPLLQQEPLLASSLQNKIRNFNTAHLPVITANGQLSYQSDVPELPFSGPLVPELNIPKDQYRAYVEVSQPIYDGGMVAAQKMAANAENEANVQSLAVSLYQYQQQVVQTYFQVLLASRQLDITDKVIDLLHEKLTMVESALANGVLQQNDVLRIRAELLNQEKRKTELNQAYQSGMEVLSLLTGIDTGERTLQVPETSFQGEPDFTQNPELSFLLKRQQSIEANEQLLQSRRMPRLSFFGQAGVGSPNPFNFFKNETSGFYIAGLRASWTILDWSKTSREKQNLTINASMVDLQRQQKEIELNSRVTQLQRQRDAYQQMLESDTQAVSLRKQIRENASSQLNEGVITSTDYLDEVLAEQQAESGKNIDEINMYKNNALIQLEQGTLTP